MIGKILVILLIISVIGSIMEKIEKSKKRKKLKIIIKIYILNHKLIQVQCMIKMI